MPYEADPTPGEAFFPVFSGRAGKIPLPKICWSPAFRAPRVSPLIAGSLDDAGGAQLDAAHRLKDLGGDRKALLPPALRLGAVQHIVREEAEISRGSHLARHLAGQR